MFELGAIHLINHRLKIKAKLNEFKNGNATMHACYDIANVEAVCTDSVARGRSERASVCQMVICVDRPTGRPLNGRMRFSTRRNFNYNPGYFFKFVSSSFRVWVCVCVCVAIGCTCRRRHANRTNNANVKMCRCVNKTGSILAHAMPCQLWKWFSYTQKAEWKLLRISISKWFHFFPVTLS